VQDDVILYLKLFIKGHDPDLWHGNISIISYVILNLPDERAIEADNIGRLLENILDKR
jgi:hypothetical protein